MSAGIAELVDAIVESRLARVYTALAGVVESYDPATNTASVRPVARHPIPGATWRTEELPVIQSVPVQFPRGGGYAVCFPVAAGDGCLLVITTDDASGWRTTGELGADPVDPTLHGLGNAVAIMGWEPDAEPPAGAGENALTVSVPEGGEIRLAGSGDAVALASKVDAELARIWDVLTGASTPPWVPVPTDGGAALIIAATAVAATVEPTGSERVKAE